MPAKSTYSVHPSIAYVQNILANFKAKTRRSVDEWVAFVKKEGPKTEAERRAWLKAKHELGTNYAWWIAERSVGKGDEDGDPDAYLRKAPEYVADMFAGEESVRRRRVTVSGQFPVVSSKGVRGGWSPFELETGN